MKFMKYLNHCFILIHIPFNSFVTTSVKKHLDGIEAELGNV